MPPLPILLPLLLLSIAVEHIGAQTEQQDPEAEKCHQACTQQYPDKPDGNWPKERYDCAGNCNDAYRKRVKDAEGNNNFGCDSVAGSKAQEWGSNCEQCCAKLTGMGSSPENDCVSMCRIKVHEKFPGEFCDPYAKENRNPEYDACRSQCLKDDDCGNPKKPHTFGCGHECTMKKCTMWSNKCH